MALSYGLTGTKQKDWMMFVFNTGIMSNFPYDYVSGNYLPAMQIAIAIFDSSDVMLENHLGELRADSISLTGDNGDTIEGNIVGEITLNKAVSLTAELINATVDNANQLSKLDGQPVSVFLFEKFDVNYPNDNFTDWLTDTARNKTLIVIPETILRYSESITAGDITRGTVKFSKTTGKIRDFRQVYKLT